MKSSQISEDRIAQAFKLLFGVRPALSGQKAASGTLVATPKTSSYEYLRINTTTHDPGTNYHICYHYGTFNIYQSTWRFLFGGECIYGELERKTGFKWTAPRFQISAHITSISIPA
jgi:hypothetical protein